MAAQIIFKGIGGNPGGLVWFLTGGLESGAAVVPPDVAAVYVITVPAQLRTITVAAQPRTITVPRQPRTITVPAQSRRVTTAAQRRTIVVRKPSS